MKIIILAAGKGERLMPLTKNTPKPLLDMGNGATLLEEQIASLQESGVVEEIVLVIGYLADQVEAKLQLHQANGVRIRTIYNPFYEVSNNLMSLWFAQHEMDEDFLVTNGDNIFAPEVFTEFVGRTPDGIHLAVSRKNVFGDEDMKVSVQEGGIARVSKQIPPDEIDAESPGLALVRGARARRLFVAELERLARRKEFMNKFWLEIFNHLFVRGVTAHPWFFDGQTLWQEVDFHSDVRKLRNMLEVKGQLLKRPQELAR
jgi:choline kinase